MDLGAPPFRVFLKVTLPLIAPGIVAAAMLAFALSLDDFIITLFNAGNRVTYPLYVYGARRAAFPPQINVLATAILLPSLLVLGATVLWQQRRLREMQGDGEIRPIAESVGCVCTGTVRRFLNRSSSRGPRWRSWCSGPML